MWKRKYPAAENCVRLFAEGPLFEGSNTIQGEITTNINEIAKQHGISVDEFTNARLKSVTLYVDDSTDFDLLSSITMQFASDKTDMIEVALINPVPSGSTSLKLTVAGEQANLVEVLKQEKFTAVADAILTKDSDAGLEIRGDFEFELTYKK